MSIEVRYYSRGSNTRRLAEAVAKELGVSAVSVEQPMNGRADVVFLCASVYAGGPDKAVTTFVRQNARDIGRLVVLSTSASGKSTHAKLKAAAEDMGVTVSDAYFQCPGAFMVLHRGRPNAEDCARAAGFAKAQL
ncbi:MAG: flavodoxin [Clostridia bacterium]|nr:flavodoxin [Clostridia bacterium]